MKCKFIFLVAIIFGLTERCTSQWVQTNGPEGFIYVLATSGTNLYAGTYENGFFYSDDYGADWIYTTFKKTSVNTIAVFHDSLFIGTDMGLFFSVDKGKSWLRIPLAAINPIVRSITISGHDFFAGTESGIYHSTHNGFEWTRENTSSSIYSIIVFDTNLFAGGFDVGILLSTDRGKNWKPVNKGLADTHISSLFALGSHLIAGSFYEGAFLSTDNGASWQHTGLGKFYVTAFTASGNYLFAATAGGGTFVSGDSGESWIPINGGLTNPYVYSLTVSSTDLYIGTGGSGVWKLPISEAIFSGVTKFISHSARATLEQNVPNPFEITTKITFSLEHSAFVSLKILDILGREVSVLASEELPAGSYSRDWNASAFLPGEYFCRLQAGAYSETKKLMLVK